MQTAPRDKSLPWFLQNIMDTKILLLAALLLFIPNSDCQCTFPSSLVGTWVTSGQGTWIVNSTHIQDFRTVSDSGRAVSGNTPFTTLTFECNENQGDTKYVLKSEPFEIFNGVFISLYICLDIREITDKKYIFYKATEEDVNGDQFTGQSDYALVCNSADYEMPYRYRVALKSGSEMTQLIQCPPAIFGTYTYDTCTDAASNTSSMDVCDSRQQLIYNYTLCDTPQMFTLEGTLDCVYFESNASVTYLTVYNRDNTPPDESSYFRFTCMALELVGDDVKMTVYPERCVDSQNTTSIDSPGYAVYFTPFYLCPITSDPEEENNWWLYIVIGVGALLGLLLLAALILCIYRCCCRKKKKKKKDDEESVKDESDSEAEPSRPPSRDSSRRHSGVSQRSSIKSMDSGIGEPQPTPLSSRSEEDEKEDEKHQNEDDDDDDPEKVTELILTDDGEKEVEDKTSRPASSQRSRMSDLPPSTLPPEDDRKTPASIRERQIEDELDNDNKSIREENPTEDDSQSIQDQDEQRALTPEDKDNVKDESEPGADIESKQDDADDTKSVHSTCVNGEETKSMKRDDTDDHSEDDKPSDDGEIKTGQNMDESKSDHGDTQEDKFEKHVETDDDTKSEGEDKQLDRESVQGPDGDDKPNEDKKSIHSETIENQETKSVNDDGDIKSQHNESLPYESEVDIDDGGEKSEPEEGKDDNIEENKQMDKPVSRQEDDDVVTVPIVHRNDEVVDDKDHDTKSIHDTEPVKQNVEQNETDDNQSMVSDTKSENQNIDIDEDDKHQKDPVKSEQQQEEERREHVKEDEKIVEDKTINIVNPEEKRGDSDSGNEGGSVVLSAREKTPVKQSRNLEPNRRTKDNTEEPRDSGRQTEVRSDEEQRSDGDGYHTSDDENQRQYHKIGLKGSKSFEPSGALTTVLVTRDEEERKRMKIKSKSKRQRMTKLARKRTRKLGHKSDKHGYNEGETGFNENGMTSTDDEMLYDQSGNKAAFMKQYLDKKRLEHILDEQHYWSDPDDENNIFHPQSVDSSMVNSEVDGDDEYVIVVGPDGQPRKVKKTELSGYNGINTTDDELKGNNPGAKDELDFVKHGKFVTVLGVDNEPWLVKKSNLVDYLSTDTEGVKTTDSIDKDVKGKNKGKLKDGTEDKGIKKHDEKNSIPNAEGGDEEDEKVLNKENDYSKHNIAFVKENDIVTVIGPDNEYKRMKKQDLLNILNSDKESDRHKKKRRKLRSDDPSLVEKGDYVTIVGSDGIPRRIKKSDLKLYFDPKNIVSDQGMKDKDGNDISDLSEKLDFVEKGDYVTVIGADGQQRRIKKTDLAKFLEQESEKDKKLKTSSTDNLAYVENPENIDENNSKTRPNGKHEGKTEDNGLTKTDKNSKGAKTKLINVKERPHESDTTHYRHRRRGDMAGDDGDILSDFCDTDLDKISDRDSGLSDEEEEAVDVILTQDQQQMIVNMLFDEDMNLRPQFDRDEHGRIVRRLDNSVIYDPHTGRFTYIKRLGQLFKVPRLRRNTKGRPTGGYIEDSYGPKEVPKTNETGVKVARSASGKSTCSSRTKSSSPDQKRYRTNDGRNVGFAVPDEDIESMTTDEMEYHKRGRRDLSSAFRKALSKRLFRKKRKRGATENLPDVQLKKAWGGDPLLSGGGEFHQGPPGGVSPLFSRSGTKMNMSTPGQQRRSTGTNDPEQLQRYREGLRSDQRILENLQDKLKKDRPLNARHAFEDVKEEGGSDEDSTGRTNSQHAGHDHGLYYTNADGRLVIRERGCPELKAMSQKDPLFMIIRRPEDIEKEEKERELQNGGRSRNVHTAPVVLQSTDGSPRDSEHAQNSEESLNTRRSNFSQMTSIDDNRLRRLLEELYKDKKYFDYYIDTTKPKSDAIIHSKGLAEHGRGYLLERADYWERRGPLPPRPPQTAVGWRMQRQQTLREEQMQRTSTTITDTQESIPGAIDSPRKDRGSEESGMFTNSSENLADDSFRSSELRQSEA